MNAYARVRLLELLVLATIAFTANVPRDAQALPPYLTDWDDQFGTAFNDSATNVSVDAFGNAYISGSTNGIFGESGSGNTNAFLVKYDAEGNRIWTRQDNVGPVHSSDISVANGVSADGLGNIYLSGFYNSLVDDCCDEDLFLSKYDDDGNLAWTETISSESTEESVRVAADALGNVFVGGTTYGSIGRPLQGDSDGFVARYDGNGDLDWIRQFGGDREDQVFGISEDGLGNVYLTGYQENEFGYFEAYVTKYGSDGTQLWTSHVDSGESFTLAFGVHADGLGSVYLAGQTDSDLETPPAPSFLNQAFVAKFDDEGQFIWAQIIETDPGFARAGGVTTDSNGVVHVVGNFDAGFSTDAFVEKFTPNGVSLGKLIFDADDFAALGKVDTDGQHVYAVGNTRDSLFGPNGGGGESDAIIVRLVPIPEPSGVVLALLAILLPPIVRLQRRN